MNMIKNEVKMKCLVNHKKKNEYNQRVLLQKIIRTEIEANVIVRVPRIKEKEISKITKEISELDN